MANFNKVILAGNLTRDPQLRFLPSQTAVVDFGLAVNHKWRTPQGEDREEVLFIDCSAFGKMAETINKYCQKGKPIRSEEHTSELQSLTNLVCRLLLEKKKKTKNSLD